jgi:hypothetical protein
VPAVRHHAGHAPGAPGAGAVVVARRRSPPTRADGLAALQSSFQERFTAVHCDDGVLFVFTEYDSLLFLVVTDEGDSVPFLRRQLQLLHELLQFKLGAKPDVRSWPAPSLRLFPQSA